MITAKIIITPISPYNNTPQYDIDVYMHDTNIGEESIKSFSILGNAVIYAVENSDRVTVKYDGKGFYLYDKDTMIKTAKNLINYYRAKKGR